MMAIQNIFFPCGQPNELNRQLAYDQLRTQKEVNNVLIQDLITQHFPAGQPLWELVHRELKHIFDLQELKDQRKEFMEIYKSLITPTQIERCISSILFAEFFLCKGFTISTKNFEENLSRLLDILKPHTPSASPYQNTLQFNVDYLIVRIQSKLIGSRKYLELCIENDDDKSDDENFSSLEAFEDFMMASTPKEPIESCIVNELAIIGDIHKTMKIIDSGYVPDIIVPELLPLYKKDRKEKILQLVIGLSCLRLPLYLVGDLADLLYQSYFILGRFNTMKIVQMVKDKM